MVEKTENKKKSRGKGKVKIPRTVTCRGNYKIQKHLPVNRVYISKSHKVGLGVICVTHHKMCYTCCVSLHYKVIGESEEGFRERVREVEKLLMGKK